MLEQYFRAPYALLRLRAGLSGPYMDAFADSLEASGYSVKCATEYLRIATHLGDFLQRARASMPSVGPSTLEAFLRHLPRCRCPRFDPRKVGYNARCGVKCFHEHLVQTKSTFQDRETAPGSTRRMLGIAGLSGKAAVNKNGSAIWDAEGVAPREPWFPTTSP